MHHALPVTFVLLAPTLLAGCTVADLGGTTCTPDDLIWNGVEGLTTMALEEGGFRARTGGDADPRTTAWALIAAGFARRTGIEGLLDPEPHVAYLKEAASGMMQEGTSIDSAANNASLLRVAFLAWGTPPSAVPVDDPLHPNVTHLEGAWQARFDETSGRYGVRFNEHLFGAFAFWLATSNDPRQHAMADATQAWWGAMVQADAGDPVDRDAWYAGYVLAALGPAPADAHVALADHAAEVLARQQDASGGVRGFDSATRADASSTAAALLGWRFAGAGFDGEHVGPAVDYLCDLQRADGTIPFSAERAVLRTKTTAEVVIALSLIDTGVPWGPDAVGGPNA